MLYCGGILGGLVFIYLFFEQRAYVLDAVFDLKDYVTNLFSKDYKDLGNYFEDDNNIVMEDDIKIDNGSEKIFEDEDEDEEI